MRRTWFQSPATTTCLLLFVTLFLAGSYFRQVVEYDNSSSRFYLLSAIVDHGTFSIDAYHEQTIDKSFHDGHYYSNKAFGSSFLAVPVYWALRTLPLTRGDTALTVPQRQMVNMATSAVCFAGLGVLLFLLGAQLGGDTRAALLMAFAFSFGSIAWVHATMFSGHIMAATFSFLAFAVLWWLRRQAAGPAQGADRHRLHMLLALVAGLAAGVGALCDYTALFLALVLALYALASRLSLMQKASFGLGGALCASQLLIYNWTNFGAPFSLSYGHMTRQEFAEGAGQGLLGVGAPSLPVLLQLLASPARGLLFIMPVFLFAVAGLAVMWRQRRDLRAEWWVVIAVSVGTLLINAGFYGWHGGWAHGPRYLVPMLPFLALPMVFAPLRSWPFGLALAASLVQVVPGVVAFPYTPQNIVNPLRDMVLPLMRHGYLADNGLSWLGASRTLGALAGLVMLAVLSVLTWRSLRNAPRQTAGPASRPLAVAVVVSVLAIAVATVTMKTERELRLRVMSRLAYDAELVLPYKDAQDFMENAPSSPPLPPDPRRSLLAAVLLAVAVLGAGRAGLPLLRLSQERGWEPWRDFQITRSMLALDPPQRDYVGPGYGRDRDYALFLWNVQRSGPQAQRIFLRVDDMQDWYRYRAAYRLAPTPVELFDPGREYAAGDMLLAWRAPVPGHWTVLFESGDGAVARRGEGP